MEKRIEEDETLFWKSPKKTSNNRRKPKQRRVKV
jgi:hypothetical protein